MVDVGGILTQIETNGVRAIRDADVAINVADCTSNDFVSLILHYLEGKKGRFETIQAINAYGAARLAGLGEDVDPDEIGDAILSKHPHLLFVPPAGTKNTDLWLVFTLDQPTAT